MSVINQLYNFVMIRNKSTYLINAVYPVQNIVHKITKVSLCICRTHKASDSKESILAATALEGKNISCSRVLTNMRFHCYLGYCPIWKYILHAHSRWTPNLLMSLIELINCPCASVPRARSQSLIPLPV